MKGKWLMIGGAALFLLSWLAHDIFRLFSSGWGATAISLVIFVSPIIVLAGIVVFLRGRAKQKSQKKVS